MRQVDEVGFRPHPVPHHFSIHALIATHQTRDTNTPQRQWRPEQHPTTAQHNGSLAALVVQPHGFVCPSASNQAPAPHLLHRRPSSPDTNAAQDNHNRLVADILTRYRTLMMLATVQAEGERSNATPETMAVSGISMKMEFDGLVRKSPPPLFSPHQAPLTGC